jgi:hypothetical protein
MRVLVGTINHVLVTHRASKSSLANERKSPRLAAGWEPKCAAIGCLFGKFSKKVAMTESVDQSDSGHESAEADRRGFGWVAGVMVLAIVFGLILGIDRRRTLMASNDGATSPVIAPASPKGSSTPVPGLTPSRSVTPNRL